MATQTPSMSNTRDELVDYLKQNHGEEPDSSATKQEILERISQLEDIDFTDEGGDTKSAEQQAKEKQTKTTRKLAKAKKVKIKIASQDRPGGDRDVFVGINGRTFLLKRDEELEIPEPVYELLEQTEVTYYKQEADGRLTPRKVKAYPITKL